MPNYRMDIEYDGTSLAGWQKQVNAKTVQEQLEKTLAILLKENVQIIGAGRTDAGVHATGQVANFHTTNEIDLPKIHHSLNAMIGRDIVIHEMALASESFHARYSAKYRQYRYHICQEKTAIGRQYKWHLCYQVDWSLIKTLLPQAEGGHDFSAFCAAHSSAKSKKCNVYFFQMEEKGAEHIFHIKADRFLYKMVRSLVGTLIDIGRGYLPVENFGRAIETGNRSLVGSTAPSMGLTLVEVGYCCGIKLR